MLLEVLLAGSDDLDGSELEAAVLEAGDDGANKATLSVWSVHCYPNTVHPAIETYAAIAADHGVVHTWTPSGLIAMKLFPTVSYTALQVLPLTEALRGGQTYVCSVVMFAVWRVSMFFRRWLLSLGPSFEKMGGSGMPDGNEEELDADILALKFSWTVVGGVCCVGAGSSWVAQAAV